MPKTNPENIPVARLAGVISHSGEHKACSLVYELETDGGVVVGRLTYAQLMEALHFAQSQALIPPLSSDWWARIADVTPCSFSPVAKRETEKPFTPVPGSLIAFRNGATQVSFVMTLATLLQCLCIAEEHLLVPPFEPEWEAATIPPVLREWSTNRPASHQPHKMDSPQNS